MLFDLTRYDLPQATVTASPEFISEAGHLMSAATISVAETYPPGALEWLKINRPDISAELGNKNIDLDDAFTTGNRGIFMTAVNSWERFYLRAWRVYREAQ